jgi:hypothetical protein
LVIRDYAFFCSSIKIREKFKSDSRYRRDRLLLKFKFHLMDMKFWDRIQLVRNRIPVVFKFMTL